LITLPKWFKYLKTRIGILSIALFIIGLTVTLGPLTWQYFFHYERIASHGKGFFLLSPEVPINTISIKEIVIRYISYFGPDFLFVRGDLFTIQSPPDIGQFHWYMLPLMLSGSIFISTKLRTSVAARLLLAMVILYPVAGSIGTAISAHALRSSPGLCPLVLLAAAGAYNSYLWLKKKSLLAPIVAVAVFSIAFVGLNIRYLYRFYGAYNQGQNIFLLYYTDFVEACEWLSGRQDQFEAVFCTTEGLNLPYIVSLVALKYDPNKWFTDPKEYYMKYEFEYYKKYGKIFFIYDSSFVPILENLKQKPVRKPILFIIRPNELGFSNPDHKISLPSGTETLWLCII
jgi:hypothetical protein